MTDNTQVRQVMRVIEPQYVIEGAGVRLRRSIATRQLDYLDPFLLFDHFGSHDPADYLAGFPLRCFQRLSIPIIATLLCHWRDNRSTRGSSIPVLSY